MIWRNSLGEEFDLTKEAKRTPGEIALRVRRSTDWVLRKVRAGEIYPVIAHNPRFIEIYDCAVADYYIRHTEGGVRA